MTIRELAGQEKAEVQARYDRRAQAELQGKGMFEPVPPAKRYFRSRKLAMALSIGAFRSGGRLLEIGCSIGQFSFPLADLGYDVWGADLSPRSIKLATQRAASQGLRGVTFLTADAEELRGCPDNGFDGVVSFSALRYVPELPKALLAVRRVLKPGARAVVDFPNRWCPWFYLKPWLGSERHPCDHWFTTSALRRLFDHAGFCDIRIQPLLFTPTVAPAWVLPLFRRFDRLGERTPGLKWAAGILMVGAKKPG